jgi:hypothetical protein
LPLSSTLFDHCIIFSEEYKVWSHYPIFLLISVCYVQVFSLASLFRHPQWVVFPQDNKVSHLKILYRHISHLGLTAFFKTVQFIMKWDMYVAMFLEPKAEPRSSIFLPLLHYICIAFIIKSSKIVWNG